VVPGVMAKVADPGPVWHGWPKGEGTMDAEELYIRLGRLLEEMPDLDADTKDKPRIIGWFGKAYALLSASGDKVDAVRLKVISGRVFTYEYSYNDEVSSIITRALAVAELSAPAAVSGSFIGAGNSFDAMAAVGKVLSGSTTAIRIVDPYMDEKTLTDFATLAKEGVAIELLSDEATYKATLEPAVARFAKQYAAKRPLEARLAPKRALHDRLIIVDGKVAWTLTQSLKDFAERSPASIIRIDGDAGTLKIAAYDDFWKSAKPIP
jgi:hypothetical protein